MKYKFEDYEAQGQKFVALLSVASICAEIGHKVKLELPFFEGLMVDFHRGGENREGWLPNYLGTKPTTMIRQGTAIYRLAIQFIAEVFEELRTGELVDGPPSHDPVNICDRLGFQRSDGNRAISKLVTGDIEALFHSVQTSMGDVRHPSLPCEAFSDAAIKCRFFGLDRDPTELPNSGIFAVIREARGHQAIGTRLPSNHKRIDKASCWAAWAMSVAPTCQLWSPLCISPH